MADPFEGWTEEPVAPTTADPTAGWTEEPVAPAAPKPLDYGDELAPLLSKEEFAARRAYEATPLSDPYAGQRAQYEEEKAAQQELVRSGFKAASEPGVDPELRDLQLAKHFEIPLAVVKANRDGWLDAYAKASGDPKKWIEENPLSAKLVLDHPELADHVVTNKPLNLLLQGINKIADFVVDARQAGRKAGVLPEDQTRVFGGVAGVPVFGAAEALLTGSGQAGDEAQQDARAARDNRNVEEIDNAEAKRIREAGPLAVLAQRGSEGRASLEVSNLYHQLLVRRGAGLDTTALEAQIYEAERQATPLALGETGVMQALGEAWNTSQSTIGGIENVINRSSSGALVGGGLGFVAGALATKTPAGAVAGAAAGANAGARWGSAYGAAEGSFVYESGDSYQQFLKLKTDAGEPLTEQEARGAALISASIKTGIELVELHAIMKAFGPAAGLVEGRGVAGVRELLQHNPGFRVVAARAAKAWAGEGFEEVSQEATDEGLGYVAAVKHDNPDAAQAFTEATARLDFPAAMMAAVSATPQKRDVLDPEALKENFVMGLLGGSLFGMGGLVVTGAQHAIFQSQEERGALLAPQLAKIASDPSAQAMAAEVAQLIAEKTGEHAEGITQLYVDPVAFRRLFQTEQEANAKATELMGEKGPEKVAEAIATGSKLPVGIEDYVGKWGKDDVAKKLADDIATQVAHDTPRQIETRKVENEKWAQAIADGAEKSETLERFDALEKQLVETGTHTKSEAKQAMVPLRRTFEAFAKKFGRTAEDLFRDVRISVDDGTQQLILQHRNSNVSERLSAELHAGLSDEERARRIYIDPLSNLRTRAAWDVMPRTPGEQVAVITSPDAKAVNDHEHGGHDTTNDLLRVIGTAIGKHDPEAARSGTNFLLHVRGQAHLAQVMADVRAALPDAKLGIEGALAPNVDDAFKRLDEETEAKRKAGTLPARGGTNFDLSKLAQTQFSKAKATERLHADLIAKAGTMSKREYFRAAYQDKDVPGILSGVGWHHTPRKAWVASIDLRGLKLVNEKYGKLIGDRVLKLFGEVAARNDGSDFDLAHLSGDEYAAQHDDPAKLQAFLDHLAERLRDGGVPATMIKTGEVVRLKPTFRSGIGEKSYGAADRVLNAAKARELRNEGAPAGAVHGQPGVRGADAAGSGGAGVSAQVGAGVHLQRETGGRRPGAFERHGAAAQAFIDRSGAGQPGSVRAAEGLGGVEAEESTDFPFGANVAGVEAEQVDELGRSPAERAQALAEVRQLIGRYTNPEKRAYAEASLHFILGVAADRPAAGNLDTRTRDDVENDLLRAGFADPDVRFNLDGTINHGKSTAGRAGKEGKGGNVGNGPALWIYNHQQDYYNLTPQEQLNVELGLDPARGGNRKPGRLFQGGPAANGPVWHSAVARAVAATKQEKNSPAAWLALISKTPGVKAEELEWLGLKKWLDEQKGSITRAQVADFIKANQIEITDNAAPGSVDVDELRHKGTELLRQATAQLEDEHYSSRFPVSVFDDRHFGTPEYATTQRHFRDELATRGGDVPGQMGLDARRLLEEQKKSLQASIRNGRLALASFKEGNVAAAESRLDAAMHHERDARAFSVKPLSTWSTNDSVWHDLSELIADRGAVIQNGAPGTAYSTYTLGGHKEGSYREILFRAPGTTADNYKAPHFDTRGHGLLAHARVSTHHLAATGSPVYFIEEIQSDLHQRAREHGYDRRKSDVVEVLAQDFAGASSRLKEALDDAGVRDPHIHAQLQRDYASGFFVGKELAHIDDGVRRGRSALDAIHLAGNQLHEAKLALEQKSEIDRRFSGIDMSRAGKDRVPDAPFKTTWDEMVAKRLLRDAAERGFDRIGWTTGEQQAERYDLAQHVDQIHYYAEAKQLEAMKDGAVVFTERNVPPEKVADYIGVEAAARLLGTKPREYRVERDEEGGYWKVVDSDGNEVAQGHDGQDKADTEALALELAKDDGGAQILSGAGLKLGGEGMKAAYDRRIPKVFEKLVKKFGGKVQKETLAGAAPVGIDRSKLTVALRHGGEPQIWDVLYQGRAWSTGYDSERAARDAIDREIKASAAPEAWTVTLPEELRKLVLAEGNPLFQPGDDVGGPKGFTDTGVSGIEKVYRIGLTKNANKSTFLHESAHVFLDLFSDLAARADAPEAVRQDFARTLRWLGADSAEGITIAQQEKWAQAFEVYLGEGKYPTDSLAGAFQRFRLWMGSVYRSLSGLGEVNPEIRGVFDRMLATDHEIAATKAAMGLRALPREALGMTPEEYATHLDQLAKATSHAAEAADFQVTKDQLRATESWWKDEKDHAKEKASADYEALPARQAQQLLQGKPAGEFLGIKEPLNRAAVVAMVGEKNAKKFHIAKDGIHPDEIAEAQGYGLGFATGKDMLAAVLRLPEKAGWVDAKAEDAMRDAHPGVLDERTRLRALVQQGLHGAASKEWVLKEWAALHAKTKEPGKLPPAQVIKRAAEIMAAGREVGNLGVRAALVAERTAANNAATAAAKGNYAQAAVFKQQQLLNMYLHGALTAAKKETDQFLAKAQELDRPAARARLGKGSPIYRDAVAALLATFDLGERQPTRAATPAAGPVGLDAMRAAMQAQQPAAETRADESLDATLRAVEQLMTEDQTPVGFDRARIVDRANRRGLNGWQSLPVEDMRQVFQALKNIEAAARNRSSVLLDEKRADLEFVEENLMREASALEKHPDAPTRESETIAEALGRRWTRFDGALLKIETMARWLGGGADTAAFLRSFWFRAIVKPMQDGKARETDLYRRYITPLVDAFKAIPKSAQSRQMELIDGRKLFPDHVELKLPKRRYEILMMLLNSGNASNLARLTEGRNITEEQLRAAAVEVGVTKEEYAWLQSIWDAAEGLKPLAFDLEERDSGVRPEEIVAKAFSTPFGMIRGGYFPAVYDRDVTAVGKRQEASLADFQDNSYTRPSTQHNFLKARVEGFSDVISLSPGSINRHFAQVVHDVAFREAVKSVGTLLLRENIQATLRERLGQGRADQFVQWAKDVASMRGVEGSTHAQELMEWARAIRGNVVTAVLGYKIPNALEDFTSNLLSAVPASDLRPAHLAGGLAEFAGSPMDTRAMALEKSGELRTRQHQIARELAKQIRSLTASGPGVIFQKGPLAWYKDGAFAFAEAVEVATATPIWTGAYRQALSEAKSDADAVTFADATVRQVLVSHNAVDLSAIMRDKGPIGYMTMFFGAFNQFYDQFRDLGHRFTQADDLGTKAAMAGRSFGLAVGLFLIGSLARGQGPNPDEPENEFLGRPAGPEPVSEWMFRKLVLEGLLAMIPGLNVAGQAISTRMQGKKVEARNNSILGVFESVTDSLFSIADSEKDAEKRVRELLKALGPVTGVPLAAPEQAGGPLLQWAMDQNEWRNPFDAASDLIYGRKPNQPWNALQGVGDAISGPRN